MSWQLASFALLGLALAAGFAWYERSKPSSRTVALVATLAALATLGRIAFAPLPNVKPTTDIVLIAGYVLGGAPGFTVGAVSAIASNVVFGEGPWTPWQMLAWGLVGIAGCAALAAWRAAMARIAMALVCGLAGFGYGFVVDLYTWLGYSQHTVAQYLAVEGTSFPFNLAHAGGNFVFYLAFGPALVRALRRFQLRMHVTWVSSGAPSALLVAAMLVAFSVGASWHAAPARAAARTSSGRLRVAARASPGRLRVAARTSPGWLRAAARASPVSYLVATQRADGGWGLGPGQASSAESTGWVLIGLAAAHAPSSTIARGAAWITTHEGQIQTPGDLERTILALAAARAPLGSLVQRLDRRRSSNGSFEGQANWTAFAILAQRAARAPIGNERAWLARQQNADGGFSFAQRGDPSDVDDTAGAIEALVAAGAGAGTGMPIPRATRFLERTENPDGGFPLEPGGDSNAQSTAWAVQALLAARAPASRPLRVAVGARVALGCDRLRAGERADARVGDGRGAGRAGARAVAIWFRPMIVGVPAETAPGERRVALVPEVVRRLPGAASRSVVEAGAGAGAMIPDALYVEAGARIAPTAAEVWAAPLVVKVAPPSDAGDRRGSSAGAVLIGFLEPLGERRGRRERSRPRA